MSKFIEVEKFLEPYEGLEDSDIICLWLIKENLKQQPAAEVVSREYFESNIELYSNLLDKALTTIYKLLEIIRKGRGEIGFHSQNGSGLTSSLHGGRKRTGQQKTR